jgi:hypothetical protein
MYKPAIVEAQLSRKAAGGQAGLAGFSIKKIVRSC